MRRQDVRIGAFAAVLVVAGAVGLSEFDASERDASSARRDVTARGDVTDEVDGCSPCSAQVSRSPASEIERAPSAEGAVPRLAVEVVGTDGHPIINAWTVVRWNDTVANDERRPLTDAGATDDGGHVFLYANPATSGQLTVSAVGYAYEEVTLDRGTEGLLRVELDEGWSASGYLVDGAGVRVERRARVFARSQRYLMANASSSGRTRDATVTAETEPDGSFTLRGLVRGESYYLQASSDELVSTAPVGPICKESAQTLEIPVSKLSVVALEIEDPRRSLSNLDARCHATSTIGPLLAQAVDDTCKVYALTRSQQAGVAVEWLSSAAPGKRREIVLLSSPLGSPDRSEFVSIHCSFAGYQGVSLRVAGRPVADALAEPTIVPLTPLDEAGEWGIVRLHFGFPRAVATERRASLLRGMKIGFYDPNGDTGIACSCRATGSGDVRDFELPQGRWLLRITMHGSSFVFPSAEGMQVEVANEPVEVFVPLEQHAGIDVELADHGGVPYTGAVVMKLRRTDQKGHKILRFEEAPYQLWGLTPAEWEVAVSPADSMTVSYPGGEEWRAAATLDPGELNRIDIARRGL